MRTHLVRPAVALGLAAAVVLGAPALAAPAPKTGPTSSTFYLAQTGCGAEEGPGRLEVKAGASDSTGCGTIGGLAIAEVFYQLEGEPTYDVFSTVGKGLPIKVDGSKKVTGQIAAGDWVGVGGIGEVDIDVLLTGVTVGGKTIEFGTATGSTTVVGETIAEVPFEMVVPAAAAGQAFKSLELSVSVHGMNQGMSARQLDGESYLVIPTKK